MISILLPSRGRPHNLARLYESLVATTEGAWELIVRLDTDDPSAADYHDLFLRRTSRLDGPRGTLSAYWNDCWRAAHPNADIFMLCGDDITFNTPGWDRIVRDAFPPDGIAYVHGDDLGGKGDRLGTHGFLRREWTDAVGTFVAPYFASDMIDLWLTEVADAIGRRVFVPIVTEHHHPGFGKAELDATYTERIARHQAEDCDAIYRRTADERAEWADKLRAVMALTPGAHTLAVAQRAYELTNAVRLRPIDESMLSASGHSVIVAREVLERLVVAFERGHREHETLIEIGRMACYECDAFARAQRALAPFDVWAEG